MRAHQERGDGEQRTGGAGGAGEGGAIFEDTSSGLLTIIDTTISNNKAFGGSGSGKGFSSGGGGLGGGVFVYFSPLHIQSSTVSGNQALGGNGGNPGNGGNGEGGGVFFEADDNNYAISNSTFSGNSATGGVGVGGSGGNAFGGAIFNDGTSTTGSNRITNATIANNRANGGNSPTPGNDGVGEGGGIYDDYGGVVRVGSTIIAKDSVSGGPGGFGTVTTGTDVYDVNRPGGITSLGFNLIGDDDQPTGDFTNGANHDQVGSTGSPIDPLLGPLQNNGGPTDTLALALASPAIDQGSNQYGDVNDPPLVFDQREANFFRTVDLAPPNAGDGTDVGAFEAQVPTINTSQQPSSATVGDFDRRPGHRHRLDQPQQRRYGDVQPVQLGHGAEQQHAAVHRHRDAQQQRRGHLEGLHGRRRGHRLLGGDLQRRLPQPLSRQRRQRRAGGHQLAAPAAAAASAQHHARLSGNLLRAARQPSHGGPRLRQQGAAPRGPTPRPSRPRTSSSSTESITSSSVRAPTWAA